MNALADAYAAAIIEKMAQLDNVRFLIVPGPPARLTWNGVDVQVASAPRAGFPTYEIQLRRDGAVIASTPVKTNNLENTSADAAVFLLNLH
jgi:hypothetical protein